MAIYVVGSSKNLFPELDSNRIKYVVDTTHEGDNIDAKNPWYCETTALYYMWKNSDAKYVGLEHYRRFFTSVGHPMRRMSSDEAASHLDTHQIIVTEYSHGPRYCAYTWFKDAGKFNDLLAFMKVNSDIAGSMQEYLRKHTLIQCNMFIGRKEVIDEYCAWLFPRLEKFDEAVGLNPGNYRIDGYLAEHIFGMWLEVNKVDMLKVPKVEMHYTLATGHPIKY